MIDTINGATSSAIIYSIAETAKVNNLKLVLWIFADPYTGTYGWYRPLISGRFSSMVTKAVRIYQKKKTVVSGLFEVKVVGLERLHFTYLHCI